MGIVRDKRVYVDAYGMAQHGTAQHDTARHSTAPHGTAQHSRAQHSRAEHSTGYCSTYMYALRMQNSSQCLGRRCISISGGYNNAYIGILSLQPQYAIAFAKPADPETLNI